MHSHCFHHRLWKKSPLLWVTLGRFRDIYGGLMFIHSKKHRKNIDMCCMYSKGSFHGSEVEITVCCWQNNPQIRRLLSSFWLWPHHIDEVYPQDMKLYFTFEPLFSKSRVSWISECLSCHELSWNCPPNCMLMVYNAMYIYTQGPAYIA